MVATVPAAVTAPAVAVVAAQAITGPGEILNKIEAPAGFSGSADWRDKKFAKSFNSLKKG
jgi:hypothetical protein